MILPCFARSATLKLAQPAYIINPEFSEKFCIWPPSSKIHPAFVSPLKITKLVSKRPELS
jgi:hypothetical protein